MPRSRYRIADERLPHFLTCTVNGWLPVFTRPEAVEIVFDSWRVLRQDSDFEVFGYVILENHLHLVARSRDLPKDVQRFKSFTARKILDLLHTSHAIQLLHLLEFLKLPHKIESTYQVWEEGSHPQLIESEGVLRQKLDYMHQNPVKRGYVDLPEHWRYSSARNYAGQEGLYEVVRAW